MGNETNMYVHTHSQGRRHVLGANVSRKPPGTCYVPVIGSKVRLRKKSDVTKQAGSPSSPHAGIVKAYIHPLQESFPPHHWSQCGPFITPRSFSQHWLHTGKIDPVLRRATIHPIAMTRLLGNVDSRARFQFASRPKPKTEQSTYVLRIRLGDRSRNIKIY